MNTIITILDIDTYTPVEPMSTFATIRKAHEFLTNNIEHVHNFIVQVRYYNPALKCTCISELHPHIFIHLTNPDNH